MATFCIPSGKVLSQEVDLSISQSNHFLFYFCKNDNYVSQHV